MSMLDTFYDSHNDIFYLVPLRCGTSFFREKIMRISDDPTHNVSTNPDMIHCSNMEQAENYGGPNAENSAQWLYRVCTEEEKFKNTRVWMLYRDPIVRYKSGIEMALQSYYDPAALDLTQCDDDELERIIRNARRVINDSTFPAFNLADSHTTPVMHLQLLIYTMLPGRCKFIHLKELNDLAVEMYGVKYTKSFKPNKNKIDSLDVIRSAQSEQATEFAEKLWNTLKSGNGMAVFPTDDIYSFQEWITADVMTYNSIKNDPDLSEQDAEKLFVAALYANDLTVARCKPIARFYINSLRVMPEGYVKSALGKQIANLGKTLKEFIFNNS